MIRVYEAAVAWVDKRLSKLVQSKGGYKPLFPLPEA